MRPAATTVPFPALAYHRSVPVEPTKGFVMAYGPLSAQKLCVWLATLTEVIAPNEPNEKEGGDGVPPPLIVYEREIRYW